MNFNRISYRFRNFLLTKQNPIDQIKFGIESSSNVNNLVILFSFTNDKLQRKQTKPRLSVGHRDSQASEMRRSRIMCGVFTKDIDHRYRLESLRKKFGLKTALKRIEMVNMWLRRVQTVPLNHRNTRTWLISKGSDYSREI